MENKLYTIDEITRLVGPVVQRYGITKAWLFGSYARGEARPDSDIDICIEEGKPLSLLKIGGLDTDLRATLKRNVDIVGHDFMRLDDSFVEEMNRDRIAIYETN
jgi:predicted nucleotidyltransferase